MKAGDEVVCVAKNGWRSNDGYGLKFTGPKYNELCIIQAVIDGEYFQLKWYPPSYTYFHEYFRPVAPQADIDKLVEETILQQVA